MALSSDAAILSSPRVAKSLRPGVRPVAISGRMSASDFSPSCRSLRVFVAEDHPETVRALGGYLEALGHRVTCAASVTEALELLREAPFDVLISDIRLPDGNGWELLERADLASDVYCVAMSGFGANADRARSRAVGYRRHLLKPFDPEELDAILDEAAGGPISISELE